MRVSILVFLVFSASALFVSGKAYHQTKNEMISSATAIAIVNIGEVEDSDSKGHHWTYAQKAKATVEKVLKGDLPPVIELNGKENFICAQCNLSKGKAIVFLRKDEDLWTGSNWHMSIRPITGDKIAWFSSEENRYETNDTDLMKVISEIQNVLDAVDSPSP